MDKIPFSLYDFFGYLAPGILLVASIDYFFVDQMLIQYAATNLLTGIVSILLVYIIGQVIATPSSLFLETLFVKKYLKDPRETLFGTEKKITGIKKLFAGYYKPLPQKVQEKLIAKVKSDDSIDNPENYDVIYQVAFSKVKKEETTLQRLNIFLNLYGFSRTISFTCFIILLILLISSIVSGNWSMIYWMIGFLISGIIMFYRFLKFYRHYAYELYLSYLSV